METDARNWLAWFGGSFGLLLLGLWIAARLFVVQQFPPVTTTQMQDEAFDRYFKLPRTDIAIVGSSLAYHLKDWYFERGDVRNVSVPGDSSLTGLAIIDAAPTALPKAIAVETNILDRALNREFFTRFKDIRRPQLPMPPFRTLAAWYEGVGYGTNRYIKPVIQSIIARPPGPRDRSAASADTLWAEWNKPLSKAALLVQAKQFKAMAAKLEARGVRIFFFEMPYPSKLNQSLYAITSRQVFDEVIAPDDDRRLTLDYAFEDMRSDADGVHLDERSSVVLAAALGDAIHKKMAAAP